MKKLNKNTVFKIIIGLIIFIILLEIINIVFKGDISKFKNELKNESIDKYNFEQLEKVKPILESIPKDAKKFYTLKELNEIYNADIKPIKNCYVVNNDNWKYSYIFWFKLYSKKFIANYWTEYYAYPKYDFPVHKICAWFGGKWECQDYNLNQFEYTISNPCKD